jgi:hypothetical protein
VILLPMATLAGLSLNQLDAVIAHELAHIRRHDFVVNLGQMLIEAGLFYHPAVWWVSARIRHERELCCDDLVIAFEHNPLDYARALASLERFRLSAALRLGADGGQLTYRIKRLIGADTGRRPVPRYPAVVASVIAILAGLAVVSSSHVSATTPQATEPSRVAMARPQAEPDSAERGSPVVPPAGAAGDDNGEQSSLDILAASQLEPPPGDAIAWAVGRRLVTIQLLGVPNAERDALHLPIGIGDRIGSETAEEVSVAVADVARHLVVRLLPLPNDGVAILISRAPVPGV